MLNFVWIFSLCDSCKQYKCTQLRVALVAFLVFLRYFSQPAKEKKIRDQSVLVCYEGKKKAFWLFYLVSFCVPTVSHIREGITDKLLRYRKIRVSWFGETSTVNVSHWHTQEGPEQLIKYLTDFCFKQWKVFRPFYGISSKQKKKNSTKKLIWFLWLQNYIAQLTIFLLRKIY